MRLLVIRSSASWHKQLKYSGASLIIMLSSIFCQCSTAIPPLAQLTKTGTVELLISSGVFSIQSVSLCDRRSVFTKLNSISNWQTDDLILLPMRSIALGIIQPIFWSQEKWFLDVAFLETIIPFSVNHHRAGHKSILWQVIPSQTDKRWLPIGTN